MPVIPLPLPAAALPPRAGVPPLTYGVGDIARRLGCDQRGSAYQLNLIRLIVAQRGFPAPRPQMWKGALLEGRAAIRANARWDRAAADRWFYNDLPPDQRDALDPAAAAFHARALDAAAESLVA